MGLESKKILSIIIPVYNADKYIGKCVESIEGLSSWLNIVDSELEVILIDDGSNDKSGMICDELCNNVYSFDIKTIHQINQGVSVARNEGLRLATGRWIWFIDADDYIEIPLDEKKYISFGDNDFVVTGFIWEESDKSYSFGAFKNEIPYNLWRCWFRRDLIRKYEISFTVGRKYAEDQEFILKYLISIGSTDSIALSDLHYHYTMRPGSAMTRSGIKGKQTRDLLFVLFVLLFMGFQKGTWRKKWFWKEIKRMTKTFIVVLSR